MKRPIVPAAAAILVLACVATGVWLAIAHAVAQALPVQARLAGDLLDEHVPIGESFARTLRQPGIHLLLIDRRAGIFVDAGASGVDVHPFADHRRDDAFRPPHEGPAGPNDAPPPPPEAERPPPPEAERPPPPEVRPQPGALDRIVLSLADVPVEHVDRGDRAVVLSGDAHDLGVWLALDLMGFVLAAGAIVALTAWSVTSRSNAERAALVARAAEQSEAAERYKRFMAETGHELRTPLTVMAGYVDILRARDPGQPLDARILEGMHAEASRMRVLVEKMMTLARLDSTVSVPRLLDIGAAAREAVLTLQGRYPGREITARTDATASIVIDADDYAAALGNILENAVKYAPESPIAVVTSVAHGRAVTAVIDRGPGIRPSDREAIFERFNRGERRSFGEGLGLGLAIVKRVANRWNGSVDCTSEGGETVFRLSFPLADEERNGVTG